MTPLAERFFSKPLQRGTTYTFKCMVKSSATQSVGIFIQSSGGAQQDAYNISLNNISGNWQERTVEFTTDNNNDYNLLTFNLGNFVGDVYFDNVSLIRKNDPAREELMSNTDFEGVTIEGLWDFKTNGDNGSNPSCSVQVVPEGYVN